MRESLPGNPTEAGPDNRIRAIADKDWRDLMTYSIEDTQFAVRRGSCQTAEDRSMLRVKIARAEIMLHDADEIIKEMDANGLCRHGYGKGKCFDHRCTSEVRRAR